MLDSGSSVSCPEGRSVGGLRSLCSSFKGAEISAPGSFQRLMDTVCHGLPFVTTYLDDVLVHSESVQQHKMRVFTASRPHTQRQEVSVTFVKSGLHRSCFLS